MINKDYEYKDFDKFIHFIMNMEIKGYKVGPFVVDLDAFNQNIYDLCEEFYSEGRHITVAYDKYAVYIIIHDKDYKTYLNRFKTDSSMYHASEMIRRLPYMLNSINHGIKYEF